MNVDELRRKLEFYRDLGVKDLFVGRPFRAAAGLSPGVSLYPLQRQSTKCTF